MFAPWIRPLAVALIAAHSLAVLAPCPRADLPGPLAHAEHPHATDPAQDIAHPHVTDPAQDIAHAHAADPAQVTAHAHADHDAHEHARVDHDEHAHGADEAVPDRTWTAACPCGCADAPASGGFASRLRLGPLSPSPVLPRPDAFRIASSASPALPTAPLQILDPVPI